MSAPWHNYPLGIFTAAISTSIGGILLFLFTLDTSTAFAYWVLDGERLDATMFLLGLFGPICLACLQLWGILYVLFLAWVLHRFIFQDASRVLTVIFVAPIHFVFSFIVFTTMSPSGWNYWNWDKDFLIRLTVAALVLIAPLLATLGVRRLLRQKQEGNN